MDPSVTPDIDHYQLEYEDKRINLYSCYTRTDDTDRIVKNYYCTDYNDKHECLYVIANEEMTSFTVYLCRDARMNWVYAPKKLIVRAINRKMLILFVDYFLKLDHKLKLKTAKKMFSQNVVIDGKNDPLYRIKK